MSNQNEYDFKSFTFGRGGHPSREKGMCLMEAVAYISGEPHTDHPICADQNIINIAIFLNDNILDDNKRKHLLEPFLWRIPGTATLDMEIFISRSEKVSNLKKTMIKKYGKSISVLNSKWMAEIIPEYIKLLDELISMTEIKEVVNEPEILKEPINV